MRKTLQKVVLITSLFGTHTHVLAIVIAKTKNN